MKKNVSCCKKFRFFFVITFIYYFIAFRLLFYDFLYSSVGLLHSFVSGEVVFFFLCLFYFTTHKISCLSYFFCCLCNNNRIISIPYRHRTFPFIFLSLYDWSSFELKGKTNILRKELLLLWVTVTSREINI